MFTPSVHRDVDTGMLVVNKNYIIKSSTKENYYITIKKGFKSDGLTIPKFICLITFNLIRSIVPQWGKTDLGAIVHDWLMQNQPDGWSLSDVNKEADFIHKKCNVSKRLRFLIFLGNRIGGWYYWKKYKK